MESGESGSGGLPVGVEWRDSVSPGVTERYLYLHGGQPGDHIGSADIDGRWDVWRHPEDADPFDGGQSADGAAAQREAEAALWRCDGFGVGEVRGRFVANDQLITDDLRTLPGQWRVTAIRPVDGGVEVDAVRAPVAWVGREVPKGTEAPITHAMDVTVGRAVCRESNDRIDSISMSSESVTCPACVAKVGAPVAEPAPYYDPVTKRCPHGTRYPHECRDGCEGGEPAPPTRQTFTVDRSSRSAMIAAMASDAPVTIPGQSGTWRIGMVKDDDPLVVGAWKVGDGGGPCEPSGPGDDAQSAPDRAAWLLHPVSATGRQTIAVEQYEELRGEAVALRARVAELEAASANGHRIADHELAAEREQCVGAAREIEWLEARVAELEAERAASSKDPGTVAQLVIDRLRERVAELEAERDDLAGFLASRADELGDLAPDPEENPYDGAKIAIEAMLFERAALARASAAAITDILDRIEGSGELNPYALIAIEEARLAQREKSK